MHTLKQAAKQVAIGKRLNPQTPQTPPWFEGWYTRVISPHHSFGIITGYFPDQEPKHAGVYTGLFFNEDKKLSKLYSFDSYLPAASTRLKVNRGAEPNILGATDVTDFEYADTQGVIKINGHGQNLLYEANLGDASLRIKSLSRSQHWDDDGGSPQGLLHLIPGIGLHWYVHSTKTRVQYEFRRYNSISGKEEVLQGMGWAHVEKNWGGSFPRSFIWSQGFATTQHGSTISMTSAEQEASNRDNGSSNGGSNSSNGKIVGASVAKLTGSATDNSSNGNGSKGSTDDFDTEAQYCLAGGVLPSFNMDKLPAPLPDMLLLGYRSRNLNWHFKPHSPTIFSNTIKPEEGLLMVKAQQLTRTLVLKVQGGLNTFSRVGGPTRGGFVPHSVETYSAKATAECYEDGKLIEVTHFDRSALEFGGTYACALEKGAGRSTEGLICEPQYEQ